MTIWLYVTIYDILWLSQFFFRCFSMANDSRRFKRWHVASVRTAQSFHVVSALELEGGLSHFRELLSQAAHCGTADHPRPGPEKSCQWMIYDDIWWIAQGFKMFQFVHPWLIRLGGALLRGQGFRMRPPSLTWGCTSWHKEGTKSASLRKHQLGTLGLGECFSRGVGCHVQNWLHRTAVGLSDLPLIPHCIAFAPGGQTAHPANRASYFRGHQDRPASGTGFQELNWVRLRYPPTPLAAGGARQRRKYMKLPSARGKNLSADPTEAGGSALEKQCHMESLKAGEERMRKG